jgi:membrane protease YdiL (CAAX protease family)
MGSGAVKTLSTSGIALGGDTIRGLQGIYAMYGTLGLLLTSALVAPVVEEYVFRGVFLQVTARYAKVWMAAVLQAGVFVVLHDQAGVQGYLLVMALLAAVLAWRSGGLVAPIALHATNNLMVSLAIMGVTRSVSVVP